MPSIMRILQELHFLESSENEPVGQGAYLSGPSSPGVSGRDPGLGLVHFAFDPKAALAGRLLLDSGSKLHSHWR